MKFKSIEEAEIAFEKLEASNKSLKEENKALKSEIKEVEKAAEEAIALANESPAAEGQKDVTVTIKDKKYVVVFGVNGLTKEELAENKALCADMIKAGTAALVEVQ